MNHKAPNKEVRELLRKVAGLGCEVERLGSGHYRISRPGYEGTVVLSGTNVSRGSWQTTLKLLRGIGVSVALAALAAGCSGTVRVSRDAGAAPDAYASATDGAADAYIAPEHDGAALDAYTSPEQDAGADAFADLDAGPPDDACGPWVCLTNDYACTHLNGVFAEIGCDPAPCPYGTVIRYDSMTLCEENVRVAHGSFDCEHARAAAVRCGPTGTGT